MAKKRVFIIHGYKSAPDDCWFPWMLWRLRKKDVIARSLCMPNPDRPQLNEWALFLKKEIVEPDKNTYLVGHSLGCSAILKFIELLDDTETIGGVLCIAGVPKEENIPLVTSHKIENKGIHIYVLIASDDTFIQTKDLNNFKIHYKATVHIVKNGGHFSRKEKTWELPTALDLLEEIMTNK